MGDPGCKMLSDAEIADEAIGTPTYDQDSVDDDKETKVTKTINNTRCS